jgi:carbamoyl-phosphate synthase small subunit
MTNNENEVATLALADGTIFKGYSIGAKGTASGEVVFNTSMTGYQEILTDPSYAFQMITFTYPHIGNVGANPEDIESDKIYATGIIVRELSKQFSNHRSTESLSDFLLRNKVVGISGIDTRELVLHLREHGSQMGVISTGECNSDDLVIKARELPSMEGLDLVSSVTTKEKYYWTEGTWTPTRGHTHYTENELKDRPLVIAIDYGIKYNILRLLIESGFRVLVVPASMSAKDIIKENPQGVFLSNGPGDPATLTYAINTVRELLGKTPIFGICLGHQVLAHAIGAKTFKLKFGHRGGNHPVKDKATSKIEITSQNHGFAVDAKSISDKYCVSHVNLNDETVEGFDLKDLKAFSIQYHPEASPGPHDARYIFKRFKELVG